MSPLQNLYILFLHVTLEILSSMSFPGGASSKESDYQMQETQEMQVRALGLGDPLE